MKKLFLSASLFLGSLAAFGAGYQLNMQGLRQLAMGGTGSAWVWDASTIFYNPGGLACLKNIQIYCNVIDIIPRTGYSNGVENQMSVKKTFTPINFYLGGPIRQGSPWAVGIGVYEPFGNGLQWNGDWVGRYIDQSTTLKVYFVQPTLSYRVGSVLSVGAGMVYALGSLDMNRALPVQDQNGNDGQAVLHGTGNGVGFNAGVHFKMSDGLQIGLTYRSQVSFDVNGGSAQFNVPFALRNYFPNTNFGTTIPLPQVATLGFAVRPGERLTFQFDLNYTGWNSLDTLRVNFGQQTTYLRNIAAPRKYKNVFTPRLGVNVKLSRAFSVMGGIAYDPTPVPDNYLSPDLPDANRVTLSCGFAFKPMPRLTILAAYEGMTTVKRTGIYEYAQFYGTYQSTASVPGIGVYYNF